MAEIPKNSITRVKNLEREIGTWISRLELVKSNIEVPDFFVAEEFSIKYPNGEEKTHIRKWHYEDIIMMLEECLKDYLWMPNLYKNEDIIDKIDKLWESDEVFKPPPKKPFTAKYFITLTYKPDATHDIEQIKAASREIDIRFRHPEGEMIFNVEYTKNMVPHAHIYIDSKKYLDKRDITRLWKHGFVDLQKVRKKADVIKYVSKEGTCI